MIRYQVDLSRLHGILLYESGTILMCVHLTTLCSQPVLNVYSSAGKLVCVLKSTTGNFYARLSGSLLVRLFHSEVATFEESTKRHLEKCLARHERPRIISAELIFSGEMAFRFYLCVS